ncbi:MAG: NmrA family NAD(P)-binding protein [Glaciimonas sp.]|nr:NmrA family NAD(P)-binding protein [Glaciimonas sp.]
MRKQYKTSFGKLTRRFEANNNFIGEATMILVFGASGTCGEAVTRALVKEGAKVRGFVRHEEKAAIASAAGASEIVLGDLRNMESLEKALNGVTEVFYMAPRFVADEAFIGRMVIRMASRAGVQKFVFQSALHSNVRILLHHEFKREVEEALYESDLDFTILQLSRLMHNILPSWTKVLSTSLYSEPFSANAPISDVDYEDVAEAAALALTKPGYGRATFELSCEGMLNRHQRVELMSDILGNPIKSVDISVEEWLAKAGIFDVYEREARTRMFNYYDDFGFKGGNALVLRSILGREPSSYRAFIEKLAQSRPTRNQTD